MSDDVYHINVTKQTIIIFALLYRYSYDTFISVCIVYVTLYNLAYQKANTSVLSQPTKEMLEKVTQKGNPKLLFF